MPFNFAERFQTASLYSKPTCLIALEFRWEPAVLPLLVRAVTLSCAAFINFDGHVFSSDVAQKITSTRWFVMYPREDASLVPVTISLPARLIEELRVDPVLKRGAVFYISKARSKYLKLLNVSEVAGSSRATCRPALLQLATPDISCAKSKRNACFALPDAMRLTHIKGCERSRPCERFWESVPRV